jgi:hypothetical protein|tara:strand:+ start:300 stop:668 length:369 start_codon:yes stop_codon:yes gene_type:complete
LSLLPLLLLISLSSCSLLPKEVAVQTKFVERQIPIQGHPQGVSLYPVTFYAVTSENFEEFKVKFEKEYGDFVFFAMSVPDYENLSLNMAELKRYIDQQKTIIVYYEKSINNEYKAQVGIEND